MPLEAIVSKVQTSPDGSGWAAARAMYAEGGLGRFYVAPEPYVVGCIQPAIQYTLFDQIKRIVLAHQAHIYTKRRTAQNRSPSFPKKCLVRWKQNVLWNVRVGC